jgi:mono/diheme cytochrome c family protein
MKRLAALGLALACAACGGGGDDPVLRGERVYQANCTVCHALDPAQDGTVGPALAGASQELIAARLLGAGYPPGYTPKRDTQLMPPLPFLAAEAPALAAYLNVPPARARE